jgi:hypothetical protein
MSLRDDQYDYRGTRTSWRKWKRHLKAWTSRKFRRASKDVDSDVPARRTRGWTS